MDDIQNYDRAVKRGETRLFDEWLIVKLDNRRKYDNKRTPLGLVKMKLANGDYHMSE